ncbi:MAG: 4-hydroxyphenylacetate 3-monooxygenase, oxygenase component [Gammaproteobacteria bacterium]|nr:4-hydroxyphenylacetate 3-monooxygenase, oxygenase component [Gammaproteobacteria bacterium]
MAVRTGAEYLESIRDGREVWMRGKRVEDVTVEPGLAGGAHTLAQFMDNQTDDPDTLTFQEGDERFPMSFLLPKTEADVRRRGTAYYEWAKWSNGMFGRTPDYKNASVMAFAGAAEFLNETEGHTDFAANMRAYYAEARHNDYVLTHTLVNPQFNAALAKEGLSSPEVALQVVKETDAGIIVKGARLLATLGPHANEIEVFPSTLLKASEENIPFAFAFSVPIDTKGLRLICRDTFDEGKSHFDAPLASRFEEMDAVVIFDDVLVPWERLFMYRDPLLCNRAFAETNAVVHMMHQVAWGKLAKAEFIVGLLCAMAQASGKDKDMFVKGQIAEAMWIAETVRALLYSAEHQPEQDQWGLYLPQRRPLDTSRNLFPKLYPKLIETIQMLGSSSLMATPCEADFSNEISGDVQRYFQLTNLKSRDRVALFRLAHDVAVSGFGNRQVLYERFFFGPQNIMASIYFDLYNKDDMMDRVTELLNRS